MNMSFEAYMRSVNCTPEEFVSNQEEVCKHPYWAYKFARDVPGADIEKCQEVACKDPYWAYCFASSIPGADKEKCRKACDGSKYAF